jgi:hypothetical protein
MRDDAGIKVMNKHPQNKCRLCGSTLEEGQEYLCDSCFTKEMQKDIEWHRQHSEEEDREESELWRFTRSNGRSVFKE